MKKYTLEETVTNLIKESEFDSSEFLFGLDQVTTIKNLNKRIMQLIGVDPKLLPSKIDLGKEPWRVENPGIDLAKKMKPKMFENLWVMIKNSNVFNDPKLGPVLSLRIGFKYNHLNYGGSNGSDIGDFYINISGKIVAERTNY